jgi:glutamyl-tRNA(Gln) amidotransferase subunit E
LGSKGSDDALDLKSINLKIGLEVHQQLATSTKLFCACPPFSEQFEENFSEKIPRFSRVLRPVSSELGEFDEAAQFESRKEIKVNYVAPFETSCLVEADEEPPHPISVEGLETALIFGLSLGSRIVDEIHVMRKIVVDGSNTSGFQRTAAIALGGELKFGKDKKVRVQSISLEEDAARAVKDEIEAGSPRDRSYALDRLGSPLVEVALAPIEGSLDDAEEAAKTFGKLMRSTGRVARGIGTIRQDLNISVMNGKVIEVKGVQRLDQFKKVINFEAVRQKFFFDLSDEIKKKIGNSLEIIEFDATDIFKNTNSNTLKKILITGTACVACIVVKKFAGFVGKENEFHSRLGKELGAIAKSYGLGGVFHSDELPNYGISSDEISHIRREFRLDQDDAFVLVAGETTKVQRVADAIVARIRHSLNGVPAETRAASIEGETSFLRPRPGSARMYPETDIPLIQVSESTLSRLRTQIPEPWDKQVRSFSTKYNLPAQLAEPLYDSERKSLFEKVMPDTRLPPSVVASALVDTMLSLSRSGVRVETLKDEALREMFLALNEGRFAKEAIQTVIKEMATNPNLSLEDVLSKTGLSRMSQEELVAIIDEVINENSSLITSKGVSGSRSTLMGKVMQKVRGRADGKLVSETLSERLDSI